MEEKSDQSKIMAAKAKKIQSLAAENDFKLQKIHKLEKKVMEVEVAQKPMVKRCEFLETSNKELIRQSKSLTL